MKLFANKFFIAIMVIVVLLFSVQFYFVSNSYKRDTNSYVMLVEGKGTLSQNSSKPTLLKINKKEKLLEGDEVSTFKNSLAVIEWGDKSITRLGENSKIKVKKNYVGEDLSLINIDFELLSGKTWSNVVSMFSSGSSFKQEAKGTIAAVRGTVFEMNYDNDYVFVQKHEVNLTNSSGELKSLSAGESTSLLDFSINQAKLLIDKSFEQLNTQLDKEYIQKLREEFIKDMDSNTLLFLNKYLDPKAKVYYMILKGSSKEEIEAYIKTLPEEKQKEVLAYVSTIYQVLNFENGENNDIYKYKMLVKDLLIKNYGDENYKQLLLKYSLYDLSELKNLNIQNDLTNKTINFLKENSTHLEKLKQNDTGALNLFDKLFQIEKLPIDSNNFIDKVKEVENKGTQIINDGLNNLFNINKN